MTQSINVFLEQQFHKSDAITSVIYVEILEL